MGGGSGMVGEAMARVETRPIEDLLPDPNNANKHTQRGHTVVENSIRKRGVGRGILAAGKNTEKPVIMAGNLTHEKARDAGIEEVVFVHTTGNQLVVTVRDDLDPASAEAIALGIEDNESAKLSYALDIDLLAAMSAGDNAVLSALKREDKVFGGILEGMTSGIVKSLEELETEYGTSEEDDFYSVIRIKVTPEIKERFDSIMVKMQGDTEMDRFNALISRGELS